MPLLQVDFSTLMVLLTGLAAFINCGQGADQSPDTESGNLLYHHRAFQNYNITYSIDLSSSWTNKTVALNPIDSEAPNLNNQALWHDSSNSVFYAYDGGLYKFDKAAPPNQLWQFNPSGSSGSWSQVEQVASSNFTLLSRVTCGIYASGGGLGFALGGVQNLGTGAPASERHTPGMVIYNFTSMEWLNVSTTGYSFNGLARNGVGQFVPTFGPAGLLFALAGEVGGNGAAQILPSLDSIFMFDPSSQRWSSQQTSGTAPPSVCYPCIVGAQSDNNTYEIFMYGGQGGSSGRSVFNDAVFVLSLPAFHWQKIANAPAVSRRLHSCNIIGNRQMVSVGGQLGPPGDLEPDPWDQGLGIFDLSAMEWRDRYDSNAGAYVSPAPIKAYYQQNGRYPGVWSNDIVENWFTKAGVANKVASNTTVPDSIAGASPSASSTLPSGSHGNKKGMLGGSIVGGVAALALISLFVLYLVRRRRRRHGAAATQHSDVGDGFQKPELEDKKKEVPGELPDLNDALDMVPRKVGTSELPWQEKYELPVERPELS